MHEAATPLGALPSLLFPPLSLSPMLQGIVVPDYSGELLVLAEDLGRRLLPAFDTPTGMQAPTGGCPIRAGSKCVQYRAMYVTWCLLLPPWITLSNEYLWSDH